MLDMQLFAKDSCKVIFAGVAALAAVCGLYKLYRYLHEDDDYFQRIQWTGGRSHRRVLVLGLDGAGKTRLIRCFTAPCGLVNRPLPIVGFNVESVVLCGTVFDFWEAGGSEASMEFRSDFLREINCILWVVDSANNDRLAESQTLLHKFLHKQHTDNIPIIVVSAKQDLQGRIDPLYVLKTIDIDTLLPRHRFYHIGTAVPDHGRCTGLWKLFELMSTTPTASTTFQPSPLVISEPDEGESPLVISEPDEGEYEWDHEGEYAGAFMYEEGEEGEYI